MDRPAMPRTALLLACATIAGAALLVALGGVRGGSPERGAHDGSRAPAPQGDGAGLHLQSVPRASEPSPVVPTTASSATPTRTTVVEGRAERVGDGGPIAFVDLELSFRKEPWDPADDDVELRARTDGAGRFRATLDLAEAVVFQDAFFPKQPFLHDLRAGDVVRPGETVHLVVRAVETGRFAGVVVDEDGRGMADVQLDGVLPVLGRDDNADPRPVVTGPDGRFFAVAVVTKERREPEIVFRRGGYRSAHVLLADVPVEERRRLRVDLRRGPDVSGRLVDATGAPLAGVEVEALPADPDLRSAASTDADGVFRVPSSVEGLVTLGAVLPDRELTAQAEVEVRGPTGGVLLVARRVDLASSDGSAWVAGLRLASVEARPGASGEAAEAGGVRVVGLGPNAGRLGVRALAPGGMFLSVGLRHVETVRDFVDAVLAAEAEHPGRAGVRYLRAGRAHGANSETFVLAPADVEALRQAQMRLR